MSAVADGPRSIDDLVLSPEGEEARLRAMAAIVDGIPVDVDPFEPEPDPEPARSPQMRGLRAARKESGRWTPKYPDWIAEYWGGENEADDRDFPLCAPEPEIGPDGIVWGRSATMISAPPLDPELTFEARDVEDVPDPGRESDGAVAEDVAAWLEGLGEPLTVVDLAAMTGHAEEAIDVALWRWRAAGRVARQRTREEPLWLWRRMVS